MITGATVYESQQKFPYIGAINYLAKHGLYGWHISVDMNSEYPCAIMSSNIGFENILTIDQLPDDFKKYLFDNVSMFNVYNMNAAHHRISSVAKSNHEYKNGIYYKLTFNPITNKTSKEKIDEDKRIPIKRNMQYILELQENISFNDTLVFTYPKEYFNIINRKPDDPLYRDILHATIELFVHNKIFFGNYLKKYNLSVTPNMVFFKKDKQSTMNLIMSILYKKRVIWKNKRSDAIEMINLKDESMDWGAARDRARILDLTFKVLLNSGYGAYSNVYFKYFNINIANAITSVSQYYVRSVANSVNIRFNKMFRTNNVEYSTYMDTDSCVSDTLINVNNKSMTIADFYNQSIGNIQTRGKDNFVKSLNGSYITDSIDEQFNLNKNKINYIMKHKVKKEMFNITVNGKSIIVTEDHSVMIKRNNKLISVKPRDIIKTDEFIILDSHKRIQYTSDFKIESIGIQEQYVYDIDVENDHNFFGNDILVHNSVYCNIQNLVSALYKKKIYENDKALVCDILKFNDNILQKIINDTLYNCTEYINTFSNKMVMKVEKVIQKALFAAKKKYILRVIWDEGLWYDPYEDKITGMAMKNVNYPTVIIEWLGEALGLIFDDDIPKLKKYIDNRRNDFEKIPLPQIAQQVKVNKYDDYIKEYNSYHEILTLYSINEAKTLLNNDKLINNGTYVVFPGATAIAKGAAYANHLIKIHKLPIANIMNGDGVNLLYLKPGLSKMGIPPQIVFTDSPILIDKFKKFVDYDLQFEKFFMKPLGIMLDAAAIDINKSDFSIFDF